MNGKFEDMIGRRFGRLVIINELHHGKVKCQCDCGNEVVVTKAYLKNGNTQSCGCLNREISRNQLADWAKTGGRHFIGRLASQKAQSNSKSGIKGVNWDKTRQKWVAEININGVKHFLGRFDVLENAAAARKQAEEKYFKPIIEEFEGGMTNGKNRS
jgi:hypothetical protein